MDATPPEKGHADEKKVLFPRVCGIAWEHNELLMRRKQEDDEEEDEEVKGKYWVRFRTVITDDEDIHLPPTPGSRLRPFIPAISFRA